MELGYLKSYTENKIRKKYSVSFLSFLDGRMNEKTSNTAVYFLHEYSLGIIFNFDQILHLHRSHRCSLNVNCYVRYIVLKVTSLVV